MNHTPTLTQYCLLKTLVAARCCCCCYCCVLCCRGSSAQVYGWRGRQVRDLEVTCVQLKIRKHLVVPLSRGERIRKHPLLLSTWYNVAACVVVLWPQNLYLSRMKNQRRNWCAECRRVERTRTATWYVGVDFWLPTSTTQSHYYCLLSCLIQPRTRSSRPRAAATVARAVYFVAQSLVSFVGSCLLAVRSRGKMQTKKSGRSKRGRFYTNHHEVARHDTSSFRHFALENISILLVWKCSLPILGKNGNPKLSIYTNKCYCTVLRYGPVIPWYYSP